MIVDYLLEWFYGLCNTLIDGLPNNPFPADFDLGFIRDINYFLPVSEMFELFIVFFALGGPFVASSMIIWIVVGIGRGGSTKA
jgi:hypothetical protein